MSDDPIHIKEVVWEKVLPEIARHIAAQGKAQIALDTLVSRGCNRKRILRKLYEYVGGSPKDVSAAKREFVRIWKQISKTAKAMKKVALEVEEAKANLALIGINLHDSQVGDMNHYSDAVLQRWANYVKVLASHRVSGRDHHLVELTETIQRATGRPHYEEVATLVDRVKLAFNPNFAKRNVSTAGSIRKVVVHYKARLTSPRPAKRHPKA